MSTLPPRDSHKIASGKPGAVQVTENNVVLCPSGIREGAAEWYMRDLVERADIGDGIHNFQLEKVADPVVARRLAKEGVKNIAMNVALYQPTLEEIQKATITRRLGAQMWDVVKGLIDADLSDAEMQAASNLQVKLVLSYDRRRKGMELTEGRLEQIANHMLDADADGYTIETPGGKIRSDQLALQRKIDIEAMGKSVAYGDAWNAIDKWYGELVTTHAVEQ